MIGKDIIRFHAVYWPAFLMSAGIELPEARLRPRLPVQPRREDVEVGRQRHRSDCARGRLRVDQLRYFLLREVPFGQDGNYSHEAIVNRINADLANDLGNLAQRSLTMIARNCGGDDPGPGAPCGGRRRPPIGAGLRACPTRHAPPCKAFALHTILADIWSGRGRDEPVFRVPGALDPATTGSFSAWRACSMSRPKSCG